MFIWFINGISCLYKKVKCVRKRGGKEGKECMCERSAEKGAAWCFSLLRMCYQLDSKINNPSITKHSAIKTTEYGRKTESHFRNELGAIFKMTFSLSFSFLLPYVVVSEGRGLYIDVPSEEIHLLILCKKQVPVFIS